MRILLLLCFMSLKKIGDSAENLFSEWKGYLNISAGVANIYVADVTQTHFFGFSLNDITFMSPDFFKDIQNPTLNASLWGKYNNKFDKVKDNLKDNLLHLCESAQKISMPNIKYSRYNQYVGPPPESLVFNTAELFNAPHIKIQLDKFNKDLNTTVKLLHVITEEQNFLQTRFDNQLTNLLEFQESVVMDLVESMVTENISKTNASNNFLLPYVNFTAIKIKVISCTADILNFQVKTIYGNDPKLYPLYHFKPAGYFLNGTFVKPEFYEYYATNNTKMYAVKISECFQETTNTFHCSEKTLSGTACTPSDISNCDNAESLVTENFIDIEEPQNYIQITSLIKSFTIFSKEKTEIFDMPENGQAILLLNEKDRLQIGYRIFFGKSKLPTKVFRRTDLTAEPKFIQQQSRNSNTLSHLNKTKVFLIICIVLIIIIVAIVALFLYFYYFKEFTHRL